jgi:membrane protein YqaA with SNARE-associated domain
VFAKSYDRVLTWSGRPRAAWYLAALSFAESSFFPVPPDVLLAPMVLARPQRAWNLAAWTTGMSVAGGVLGFALGAGALDSLRPLLVHQGYWDPYLHAREWFETWGFWAVLIAGFSPIPYKVFALAAGAASMSLPLFVLASLAGRGGRFFLVAALIASGGDRMEQGLRRNIGAIGWGSVAVGLIAYLWIRTESG